MYLNGSIKRYLNDLSDRLPAPGGGSAAALVGAIGTGLLEMVCNFTLGNEKYKRYFQDMRHYISLLGRIRKKFSILIDKDVKVYNDIRKAFKSKDKKIIDKTLKVGYDISIAISILSRDAMAIGLDVASKGNPNLITDVGCGIEMLRSSFNSAVFNARINLRSIKDRYFVDKKNRELKRLEAEVNKLSSQTLGLVERSLSQ